MGSGVVTVTNLSQPKVQKVAKVAIVEHGACVAPYLLLQVMESQLNWVIVWRIGRQEGNLHAGS